MPVPRNSPQTIGIVVGSFILLNRLYKIFQLTALAWDTDGDGVVEFHEVVQAVKIIFGGWFLRIKARYQRKPPPEYLETNTLEWRAACAQ